MLSAQFETSSEEPNFFQVLITGLFSVLNLRSNISRYFYPIFLWLLPEEFMLLLKDTEFLCVSLCVCVCKERGLEG